jgi:hypothetical protein
MPKKTKGDIWYINLKKKIQQRKKSKVENTKKNYVERSSMKVVLKTYFR